MNKAIGRQKPGECIISNISRISYGNIDTYLLCLDIHILPGWVGWYLWAMKRHAVALWNGIAKEGRGSVSTQSRALLHIPYSFSSRFNSGSGTNPEELLAAAHASCFLMNLIFALEVAGHIPQAAETTAYVSVEKGAIVSSHLVTKAVVGDITQEAFQTIMQYARGNCLVSQALNIKITCEGELIEH